MLKTVLWIAAACVAILVALAVGRSLGSDDTRAPEPAAAVEAAAAPEPLPAPPAPAPSSEPVPEVVPPPLPDEQQIQDDAAATGMTTVEPAEPSPQEPPT